MQQSEGQEATANSEHTTLAPDSKGKASDGEGSEEIGRLLAQERDTTTPGTQTSAAQTKEKAAAESVAESVAESAADSAAATSNVESELVESCESELTPVTMHASDDASSAESNIDDTYKSGSDYESPHASPANESGDQAPESPVGTTQGRKAPPVPDRATR